MSGTLPNIPDHIAMGVFDAFQIPYSALEREHEDVDHATPPSAGSGTIIRGGVARGQPDKMPAVADLPAPWAGDDAADGASSGATVGRRPTSTTCSTA